MSSSCIFICVFWLWLLFCCVSCSCVPPAAFVYCNFGLDGGCWQVFISQLTASVTIYFIGRISHVLEFVVVDLLKLVYWVLLGQFLWSMWCLCLLRLVILMASHFTIGINFKEVCWLRSALLVPENASYLRLNRELLGAWVSWIF